MKNIPCFVKIVLLIAFISFAANQAYTRDRDVYRLKETGSSIKGKQKLIFKDVEKLYKKRGLFNLDIDIQAGFGQGNADFELNRTDSVLQDIDETTSKPAPSFGAIVSFDFLGFGFSTGIEFNNKGYTTKSGQRTDLDYLNFPLLFYFDFNVGQKIRLDGNIGPYFGTLFSQGFNDFVEAKNFDLGLMGNLQVAYMFNKHIGVLLGGKYEYGGLNNLASNQNVKKMTTSTYNIYSGLKFEL